MKYASADKHTSQTKPFYMIWDLGYIIIIKNNNITTSKVYSVAPPPAEKYSVKATYRGQASRSGTAHTCTSRNRLCVVKDPDTLQRKSTNE